MIPLLLRPLFLSLKNYLFPKQRLIPEVNGRDLLLILLSAAIMLLVYQATANSLQLIRSHPLGNRLEAAAILEIIFLCLITIQFLSCSLTSISVLFFANDLEILRKAPLKASQIFWGKTLQISGCTIWMILVFVLPSLAAVGLVYQGGFWFYLLCLSLTAALLLIAAAAAVIFIVLIASICNLRLMQTFLIIVGCLVLFGLLTVVWSSPVAMESDQFFAKFNPETALTGLQITWLPGHWAAQTVNPLLSPEQPFQLSALGTILALTVALTLGGAVTLSLFYENAFERVIASRSRACRFIGSGKRSRLSKLPAKMRIFLALFSKEYRLFVRDIQQAAQLLLLLGICFVYLYNFSFLKNLESLAPEARLWWQGLLVLSNTALGGFVITAISTRFVFPATSLEGQSFWILQNAPLHFGQILRSKFICWLLPVAVISSVVLATGALAINAEPRIIAISTFTSLIISYGLVGLATGLGAYFARFDWEHPSQLTASLGSMIYLIAGGMLILASIPPIALLVALRTLRTLNYNFTVIEWVALIGCASSLLVIINYCAARWALNLGSRSLADRLK